MLVMVRRDVEHLQTGDGVVGHRGHPLSVQPLCSQPFRVGHVRPQLGPREGEPLALQRVQARVKGGERVRAGHGRQGEGPVPGEVLHGIRGRVEGVHFWRLDFEAWLHPLPQLPLADLPLPHFPLSQLPLPHGRVGVVQAGHVVGQQWVGGVEGDEERVVSVGGGHDVRPGVFAEGAQGGRVGPDVRRHGCNRSRRAVEWGPHVGGAGHRGLSHPAFMS